MFAKDVMTTNVISVRPETPVFEVAALLAERGISGVPVIGEDGAIGSENSRGLAQGV
jgi:CBS domain-containing protein